MVAVPVVADDGGGGHGATWWRPSPSTTSSATCAATPPPGARRPSPPRSRCLPLLHRCFPSWCVPCRRGRGGAGGEGVGGARGRDGAAHLAAAALHAGVVAGGAPEVVPRPLPPSPASPRHLQRGR
uniref:Uncharacterized protein n=1 Tax=Oryza meridionalis TaxID=40149 RepID=A0A0E0DQ50_9ORYZ